jgi:hypothetical protein
MSPCWIVARLIGPVGETFAPFEIVDAVTGEVHVSPLKLFTVGETPHGRRRISQYLRKLTVDQLAPDLARAVGCPHDWEFVPALSEQAYAMAVGSHSAVEKSRRDERQLGVLKYGNQISPEGRRKRVRRVLDPSSGTLQKNDRESVILLPKKDGNL